MSGLVVLNLSDIIRCELSINYTAIVTIDKQKLIFAKRLKAFEQMLPGFNFFKHRHSLAKALRQMHNNYLSEAATCFTG
jgi:DNA-binding LytR/AlgR family response regulator